MNAAYARRKQRNSERGHLADDDERHGTTNGYVNLGCRCEACRESWAATCQRMKDQRRGTLSPEDARHGRYATYTNYRCRCESCRAAKREYDRQRRGQS